MSLRISPLECAANAGRQITSQIATTLNGRLVVNAFDGCPDCVKTVLKSVSDFFVHRYADVRMLVRAYNSMSTGPLRDVEQRINAVRQLRTTIESGADRNTIGGVFQRLPPGVRNLFFYVNSNYVDEFVRNPSRATEMHQGLLRECEQIIRFQRVLAGVHAISQQINGRTIAGVTPPGGLGPTDRLVWGNWVQRVVGDNPLLQRVFVSPDHSGHPVSPPASGPVPPPATTMGGFHLNVPGTDPYVQDAIPPVIQGKANEIGRLGQRFDELARSGSISVPIPPIFNDTISTENFMRIPVFDASHPGVQNAMQAASAPGGATPSTMAALNNRDLRHVWDKDTWEGHIAGGTSWAPAKCPLCRHPEDGGTRRPHLRIDTDLQDQILQFLRRHVPTG